MSKCNKTVDDLFDLFEPYLSAADVLAAKLQAQVCSAITRERVRRGMTQKQFAEFLGVSQGMVSRWEAGNYNFTLEKIGAIAAKLDLDPDITITGSRASSSPSESNTKVIKYKKPRTAYHVSDFDVREM